MDTRIRDGTHNYSYNNIMSGEQTVAQFHAYNGHKYTFECLTIEYKINYPYCQCGG